MQSHPGRLALAAALAAALAGCDTVKRAEQAVGEQHSRVLDLYETARRPAPAQRAGLLQVSDTVYFGPAGEPLQTGDPLPPDVEGADSIVIASPEPMTLHQIAAAILAQTGIPVRIAGGRGPAGGGGIGMDSTFTPEAMSVIANGNGGAVPGRISDGYAGVTIRPDWQGPLSSILNLVAANFGLAWEYKGGVVVLTPQLTRVYPIAALATSSTAEATIASSLTGSGGTSDLDTGAVLDNQTSQSSTMRIETNVWEDIRATVENIVGQNGTVAVSPFAGTVTVTAGPDVQRNVASYIDVLKAELGRQVTLDVLVLTVTLDEEDSYAFDPNLLVRGIVDDINFGYAGAVSTAIEGAGAMTINVTNEASDFFGTEAVVRALSRRGQVAKAYSNPITTRNNELVRAQVAENTTYLRESQIGVRDSDFGIVASLRPGSVTTGFNMMMIPKVLADNRVLLRYNINLSDLKAIDEVSAGDTKIETPKTSTTIFESTVEMMSGSTLVLTGFDQTQDSIDRRGVGKAEFFGLGGGTNATQGRSVTVILITPRVLAPMTQLSALPAVGGERG